jgi:hypothetical protein
VAVLALVPSCRQILGLEPLADAPGIDVALPNGMCVGDMLQNDAGVTDCTWGCVTNGGPHCGVPQPAGGAVTSMDVTDDSQLGDITFVSDFDIDGDSGAIGPLRPPGMMGPVGGIDYEIRGNVAVFRFRSLTIGTGRKIRFRGSHPIALVATGSMTIAGDLDASAARSFAGPGGAVGGQAQMAATGDGAGSAGEGNNGDASGGGGGGHGAIGGAGGGSLMALPTVGGVMFDDATITNLAGGGGGGGGGGGNANQGGAGGGAVQLVALTIAMSGTINAGGGGGRHGGVGAGGAGGGAGGTILIEGRTVSLLPMCFLAVNGGGGGGGGNGASAGNDGSDGDLEMTSALGGAGAAGDGGDGGAGTMLAGSPGERAGTNGGGGGGGSVGWIRVNAQSAQIDSAVATSPALGSATASQGQITIK